MLTLKDLEDFVNYCNTNKIPKSTKIYLGDDEEVNGVHPAGFCELTNSTDEYDYFFELLYDENIDRSKPIIFIS